MGLRLENIDKVVGGEDHLKAITLDLEADTPNVLLGRTLAGKTTLLRIMAGLDKPTRGRVLVDGEDMTGVSVRKRSVAMVYQQFINYPSLTVYSNIASPLKIAGAGKTEIDKKVREIAEMLHIEDLLERLPAELSGGQQQRTAIARALVKETQLLLMDEPLVNLDYKLREELRVELQEIFTRREAVVVYTTTEPTEALMLGGHVAVIDEGCILQTGATPDVYHHPSTLKVAEVFSDPPNNYIKGSIQDGTAHLGDGIQMSLEGHLATVPKGEYVFGVRSNHLSLKRLTGTDAEINAKVELAEINGSETFIHLNHANTKLVVQEVGIHPLRLGTDIKVHVRPGSFFVYDPSGKLVSSPAQTQFQAQPIEGAPIENRIGDQDGAYRA